MSVVTTEQRGPVSIIRINRPEKRNAISSAVAIELQQAFQAFDASDQRVAILSAAGARAFTAGGSDTIVAIVASTSRVSNSYRQCASQSATRAAILAGRARARALSLSL